MGHPTAFAVSGSANTIVAAVLLAHRTAVRLALMLTYASVLAKCEGSYISIVCAVHLIQN